MSLNIKLTYQPDKWDGDVHTCEGWIARAAYKGEYHIVAWGLTRKSAYMRAYRHIKKWRS